MLNEHQEKLKSVISQTQKENETMRKIQGTLTAQIDEANTKIKNMNVSNQNLKLERDKLLKRNSLLEAENANNQKEKLIQEQVIEKLNNKIKQIKQAGKEKENNYNVGNLNSSKSEINKNFKDHEMIKQLSLKHLEQCTELADKLICIRSEVDKSKFEVLKAHKNSTSYESSNISMREIKLNHRTNESLKETISYNDLNVSDEDDRINSLKRSSSHL